jgi:hypothetical protein
MIQELPFPNYSAGWTGHIGIPGGPSAPGTKSVPTSYYQLTNSRLKEHSNLVRQLVDELVSLDFWKIHEYNNRLFLVRQVQPMLLQEDAVIDVSEGSVSYLAIGKDGSKFKYLRHCKVIDVDEELLYSDLISVIKKTRLTFSK